MTAVNGLAIGGQLVFSPTATVTAVQVDASNKGVAMVFLTHSTNAITHLGFLYGARTGTPPVYRISLQALNSATGLPDGTVLGGGSPASATFTPPADTTWNGTWQWVALSNSYTPTAGQQIAICIEYSSGTIDASNRSSFSSTGTAAASSAIGPEYALALAGTWSKDTNAPIMGIRTASERYGNIWTAISAASVTTQTHRVAIKFRLPSSVATSYEVRAWNAVVALGSAGKTVTHGIWNAAGTALQSIALDSDNMRTAASQRSAHFHFGSRATLDVGTWYYVGLEATSATPGTLSIYYYALGDAADRESWAGGTDMMLATWNGSTWTDIDTGFPIAAIELADITAPAASGGLQGQRQMTGGFAA